jgi:putative membrane protein (TIGR04086 family)
MDATRPKLWQIVLTGLLAEILLALVALPFLMLPDRGAELLPWVIPPASVIVMLAAAYWYARRFSSHFVLLGTLVGAFAALAYIAVTWGKPLPAAYEATHVLKVIGGALGGLLARQLRARAR